MAIVFESEIIDLFYTYFLKINIITSMFWFIVDYKIVYS